jgi:hypothetical protein
LYSYTGIVEQLGKYFFHVFFLHESSAMGQLPFLSVCPSKELANLLFYVANRIRVQPVPTTWCRLDFALVDSSQLSFNEELETF